MLKKKRGTALFWLLLLVVGMCSAAQIPLDISQIPVQFLSSGSFLSFVLGLDVHVTVI